MSEREQTIERLSRQILEDHAFHPSFDNIRYWMGQAYDAGCGSSQESAVCTCPATTWIGADENDSTCKAHSEESAAEEWIEQAAKMIDEWFIQKNFNYTDNTRAMIADIIRRKWHAQKEK